MTFYGETNGALYYHPSYDDCGARVDEKYKLPWIQLDLEVFLKHHDGGARLLVSYKLPWSSVALGLIPTT
jgi:hypothetical protein